MGVFMTKDNFIERANKVHVGSYDYSQLDDEFDVNSKGEIICSIHGPFVQKLSNHLNGAGCIRCGQIRSAKSKEYSTEEFL